MKKATRENARREKGLWASLRRIGADQRGLSTVEYIIILVLIAVAGISLWSEFGDVVTDKIQASTQEVNGLPIP